MYKIDVLIYRLNWIMPKSGLKSSSEVTFVVFSCSGIKRNESEGIGYEEE